MLTHVVGKVYIEFTSSLYWRHLHQCPTVIYLLNWARNCKRVYWTRPIVLHQWTILLYVYPLSFDFCRYGSVGWQKGYPVGEKSASAIPKGSLGALDPPYLE